jgi:hypothetical protein
VKPRPFLRSRVAKGADNGLAAIAAHQQGKVINIAQLESLENSLREITIPVRETLWYREVNGFQPVCWLYFALV